MSGPAPAKNRRRRNAPVHPWKPTVGSGWQHGAIPDPPDGLLAISREAWASWFSAWWAANWSPQDLPGLLVTIRAFDQLQRETPKANDITALVRLMDTYGITPAGRQARRWEEPKELAKQPEAETTPSRYAHLRTVAG